MPRGRPKGSKSKGKVGRPRKNSDHMVSTVRKSSEPSPPRRRKAVLVKQGKLTAAQVGPLIAKVSAACDSVLSREKSNGGSKFKSAIRVFTNELRRQLLSIGDEHMGSTASERKFLQLSRDRAALQKLLLNASKNVNDTRWDLRRTNQQQKAMVDSQADLQELQCMLRDLSGMKVKNHALPSSTFCFILKLFRILHLEVTLLFKIWKLTRSSSGYCATSISSLIFQLSRPCLAATTG
jgi:hypothetical protein